MLIERSELTSGSSWHAAGGFHTLNGDPNVAKLQAYTVRLYKELEELTSNAEHPAAADSQIFATDLAEHLQQALNDGRYGQLILISPPEFLNVLRSKLSSDVCRCVAELIGLDMTASPSATIAARIPKHLKHG